MTKEIAEEIVFDYGMMVSAVHDSRYYSKEKVESSRATPETCEGEEKEALIFLYGEEWKEKFWGEDYYNLFPELLITN